MIGSVLLSVSRSFSLSVLQEAVSTRDPELVRLVLRYRDYQRTAKRLAGIPVLLERLRQVGFHTNTHTQTHILMHTWKKDTQMITHTCTDTNKHVCRKKITYMKQNYKGTAGGL